MTLSADAPTELADVLRHSMHELNNALTPVLANAQLASAMITSHPAEAKGAIDDVVEAAGRAHVLIAEMRQVVRDLENSLPPATATAARTGDPHG